MVRQLSVRLKSATISVVTRPTTIVLQEVAVVSKKWLPQVFVCSPVSEVWNPIMLRPL